MTDVRQHLIDSLKRLCSNTPGGFKAVAEAIDADDQSLYQIVTGVKLPSGNAKGVGPTLQRKLDAAYPGWADLPSTTTAAAEPTASYGWPFATIQRASITRLPKPVLNTLERVMAAFIAQPVAVGAAPPSSIDWPALAKDVAQANPDAGERRQLLHFCHLVEAKARQLSHVSNAPDATVKIHMP